MCCKAPAILPPFWPTADLRLAGLLADKQRPLVASAWSSRLGQDEEEAVAAGFLYRPHRVDHDGHQEMARP